MARTSKPAPAGRIGQLIKRRREELNLTQAALGKQLGYRYGNFIAMLEGGSAAFPTDRWKDYADNLKIPRPQFLRLVLEEAFPDMAPYIEKLSDPIDRVMPTDTAATTDQK